MNVKSIFRDACQQVGIDCDTYFKIGCQNGFSNEGFVYRCPTTLRRPSNLFVVNYFQQVGFYVAWDLTEGKMSTYNYFRVLRSAVDSCIPGKLNAVSKPLEYSGWDEGTVLVFDISTIPKFLDYTVARFGLTN